MTPEHLMIPEWREAFQEMLNREQAKQAQFTLSGMDWNLGFSALPFYLHNFPTILKLPDEIPRDSPLYNGAATAVGKELAAGIKHGEISDTVVRAALFVLDTSSGNHGAYSNFSEMLAFARHKNILSSTQVVDFVQKHAISCPPCYGDVTTLGGVVGLYELNAGHKMKKFPLGKGKWEMFFQGAAEMLLGIVEAEGKTEDLETAVYVLNKTVNSHNEHVVDLANEMLRRYNKGNFNTQMVDAYTKHVGSCGQCGTNKDLIDNAAVAILTGRP